MWRASAGRVVAAVDDEIMAFGLARDRRVDGACRAASSSLRRAQRRAQIGGVVLAEAHKSVPVQVSAHAVAAFAEIVRQRRDEAEPAAGFGHAHIARRPAGAIVAVVEREALAPGRARTSDSGRYWSTRSPSISPIGMVSISVKSKPRPCAHRASVGRFRLRSRPCSATVLILICEPGLLRGVDAGQHLVEIAPARDRRGTCPRSRVSSETLTRLHAGRRQRRAQSGRAGCHWWSA